MPVLVPVLMPPVLVSVLVLDKTKSTGQTCSLLSYVSLIDLQPIILPSSHPVSRERDTSRP